MGTAQAPKKDSQPPADLGEVNRGSVMHLGRIEATGKSVPQFPDSFFGFPWLDFDPGHGHASPKDGRYKIEEPAFHIRIIGERFNHCCLNRALHTHAGGDEGGRIDD